jgi:hypothetical protein
MGHNIAIHLMKKDQLRNDKLENILEEKSDNIIKYVELGGGVIAVTDYGGDEDELLRNKTVVFVSTSYFGGIGEQSAEIYENGIKTFEQDSEIDYSLNPINTALEKIGVVRKDGMDEFDTVGLGNYRSNKSFDTSND